MPARVDTDDLLAYWRAGAQSYALSPLDRWLNTAPRFAVFADLYRDKIRKKLRSVRDAEGARDVLCELETAYCLLREPRFDLAYESLASAKGRTPDFTLTYRTHTVVHVEVARLRAHTSFDTERLLELVCSKLGQTVAGAMNVLAIATHAPLPSAAPLQSARKQMQQRAERDDALLFARSELRTRADFFKFYPRLSAIVLHNTWDAATRTPPVLWLNKQARQPLPADIARRLMACFMPEPTPMA